MFTNVIESLSPHYLVSLTICSVYLCFRKLVGQVLTLCESPEFTFRASKDLAQLVGARYWSVSVRSLLKKEAYLLKLKQAPPGSEPESLGIYCNSRLFNMAVDNHATLADKICLADDLKDRRDQGYTEALLSHIFPSIPRSDRLAIWRSDELKKWLESDPTGQWCSQNDKAFVHTAVKNYILNNREKIIPALNKRYKIIPSLGQMKAENGSSEMDSEHTQFDDPLEYVNHVFKYWRGAGFEVFDRIEYTGPCLSARPKPLDNSISPPEHTLGRVGAPKRPDILKQAKAGNLKAKQYHELLRKHSGFEDDPEDQELQEAMDRMHLDKPSRVVSGLNSHADIRALDPQLQGEFYARESVGDLMFACRKQIPYASFLRRSIRLANLAALGVRQNARRRDTGRINKLSKTTMERKHAQRMKKLDQQCEEDLKQFRLNPEIELPQKRMRRICVRLGNVQRMQSRKVPWTPAEKAALLKIANTDPSKREQNQILCSAAGDNGGVSNDEIDVSDVNNTLIGHVSEVVM